MTKIRVNPASVKSYGTSASAIFVDISHQLHAMVNECVEVHFYGPNSVDFKRKAGELASEFANTMHKDMAAMADAVKTSTSNIAKSLGGQPIAITVDKKPISPPAPKVVDYVDVDTAALEALVPVVNKHFEAIRAGLHKHLKDLTATDWEGTAKTDAVSKVSGFTSKALSACDDASKSINKYINAQITSVMAADK